MTTGDLDALTSRVGFTGGPHDPGIELPPSHCVFVNVPALIAQAVGALILDWENKLGPEGAPRGHWGLAGILLIIFVALPSSAPEFLQRTANNPEAHSFQPISDDPYALYSTFPAFPSAGVSWQGPFDLSAPIRRSRHLIHPLQQHGQLQNTSWRLLCHDTK